jgi:hypothetical protein
MIEETTCRSSEEVEQNDPRRIMRHEPKEMGVVEEETFLLL